MAVHMITLALPEAVYQHLRSQAQMIKCPLNDVIFQILLQSLPPKIEEDLPFNCRIELESMTQLSDEVLLQIAQSTMNQDKAALHDILLTRDKTEQLTLIGKKWLTQLQEDTEQLMLRKAHAYAILKKRGHQLPTVEEVRDPS